MEILGVTEGVLVGVGVTEGGSGDLDILGVTEGVLVGVGVTEGGGGELEGVLVGVGVIEGETGDGVTEGVLVGVGVTEGETGDGVTEGGSGDLDILGVTEGVGEAGFGMGTVTEPEDIFIKLPEIYNAPSKKGSVERRF